MRNWLFILLAVLIVGCTSKKDATEGDFTIEMETVSYGKVFDNEEVNMKFEFESELELPKNVNLRDCIVESVFGEDFLRNSIKQTLKVLADSLNQTYLVGEEYDSIETMYRRELTGYVTYYDSIYLSYLRKERIDIGFRENLAYSPAVFDVKTGRRVTEEELFGADYRRKVHRVLVKYANQMRDRGELPEEDDLYNNDMIQPNGNFLLSDSTITYIFHKYAIAYGVYGDIFIEIPKGELVVASYSSYSRNSR